MKLITATFMLAFAATSFAVEPHDMEKESSAQQFNPQPLNDEWTNWFVGTWEGGGTSQAGQGKAILHVELGLGGQFLIIRGEAVITTMTAEQRKYLKTNMHASDEEIDRFVNTGYQSLEVYTVTPGTNEVLGYLFDNLRCVAVGKGKRVANKETITWEWLSGHKSTRITQRLDNNRALVVERTPMADGSVMEDRGEMHRRK